MIGEATDIDGAFRRKGVYLVDGRGKYQIDTEPIAELAVLIEPARIAPQVVLAIELQRVDEDADDHRLTLVPRLFNQPDMARVQRAHRGDQAYRGVGTAGFGEVLTKMFD
jgi:hypothetical protein